MGIKESIFNSLDGAFVGEAISEYATTVLLIDDSRTVCEAMNEIFKDEEDIKFYTMLVVDKDANLGMARLMLDKVINTLKEEFKS